MSAANGGKILTDERIFKIRESIKPGDGWDGDQWDLALARAIETDLRAALAARQAPMPAKFLMPEDAWNEYATRSGLLNEHGVAPHPATAQAAYFAYQAAWNCLHKVFSSYIAARQAPTEASKEPEVGFVRVPVAAYLWLMGMGNDGFTETGRGQFWWRSAFNERAGIDMMAIYQDSKDAIIQEKAQ